MTDSKWITYISSDVNDLQAIQTKLAGIVIKFDINTPIMPDCIFHLPRQGAIQIIGDDTFVLKYTTEFDFVHFVELPIYSTLLAAK